MTRLSDWLELRPGAGSDLPVIIFGNRQPSATVGEAYAALLRRNQEQLTMFQQTGRLVRVRIDEDGRPRIEQIAEPMLRSILIDSAQWFVVTRQGLAPTPPPEYVATSILAKPEWPEMPPIRGIVEAPVFAADGTLSTEPGYQRNTRLWFQPAPGVVIPPVSDQPSPTEVAAACRLLLDELLVDFPFHDAASKAHTVALLLLPFVRELIGGPTTLHLVDAPTPGTGKGLLS